MRILIIFFSMTLIVFGSQACPWCGCGNGNFQIGVLPTFSNAFFGVRYSYSHFKTDSSSQFSRDYFQTAEAWGGYKYGKWQALAFVPYIYVHKRSDDGVIDQSGLGDITLLINYQLYSKTRPVSEDRPTFNHTLLVGGGIKLKTGQSKIDINDPDFTIGDFTNTPGTGSTDYMINVNQNLVIGDNGIISNLAYKINTSNKEDYRYGNRLYLNVAYFHSWMVKSLTVRPSAGVNLVTNEANRFRGQDVQYSAGYLLNGTLGLNLQKNKWGIVVNAFLPVAQNLFHGLTAFRERESIGLTYSF